jgi:hypothetical protein
MRHDVRESETTDYKGGRRFGKTARNGAFLERFPLRHKSPNCREKNKIYHPAALVCGPLSVFFITMTYLTIDIRDIRSRDGDIEMGAQKTRYPELSRVTVDALVVWLLAFVFGAAFWALLFHIATPLIARFI